MKRKIHQNENILWVDSVLALRINVYRFSKYQEYPQVKPSILVHFPVSSSQLNAPRLSSIFF